MTRTDSRAQFFNFFQGGLNSSKFCILFTPIFITINGFLSIFRDRDGCYNGGKMF